MITLEPLKLKGPIVDLAKVQAALDAEMKNQGQKVKALYEQVTSTWQHKPAFVVEVSRDGVRVGTNDEIFGYVNLGTKPHIIRPKGAKVLSFMAGGFVPKTMPRSLTASAGRPGQSQAFAHEVHHPGTKPRNIDATIGRKLAKSYGADLQKAIERAVK